MAVCDYDHFKMPHSFNYCPICGQNLNLDNCQKFIKLLQILNDNTLYEQDWRKKLGCNQIDWPIFLNKNPSLFVISEISKNKKKIKILQLNKFATNIYLIPSIVKKMAKIVI